MSEVVQDTHQEFWRPPVIAESTGIPFLPSNVARRIDSCCLCGTEFMSGSKFCYLCGSTRDQSAVAGSEGAKVPLGFLHIFAFQHIKQALGLPVASLIGFLAGLACVLVALLIGRTSAIQSFSEFQAVQLLRIEWLLGAVSAFLAGMLLKNTKSHTLDKP